MTYLFVYNATSGAWSAIFDSAHKILSPSTYACNLCQLTHGVFGEREAWKEFKRSWPHRLEFYHRDEFEKIHPACERYPAVLKLDEENQLTEVLKAEEIERLTRVEDLIETLRKKSG